MIETSISVHDLITELIQIGRENENNIPPLLSNNESHKKILIRTKNRWANLLKSKNEKELEYLIKGLVIYSKLLRDTLGGSASPVRFIYEIYLEKSPTNEPHLTEWVVRHRLNGYDPFGTIKHNHATSYSDFLRIESESDKETRSNMLREANRQNEYQNIRIINDRKLATERIAGAVRRGDLLAVKALLKKGADIEAVIVQLGQSLVSLARQNDRESVAKYLESKNIT